MKDMPHHIQETHPGDALWQHIEAYSPQTVGYIADPDDRSDYRCFVATDDADAFAGLCIVALAPLGFGPLAGRTVACLENILVAESHRRGGTGSALLGAALDAAWNAGAGWVWWTVEYENDKAIAFYAKNGAAFIPEEDLDTEPPERYYTAVIVNPDRAGRADLGGGMPRKAGDTE